MGNIDQTKLIHTERLDWIRIQTRSLHKTNSIEIHVSSTALQPHYTMSTNSISNLLFGVRYAWKTWNTVCSIAIFSRMIFLFTISLPLSLFSVNALVFDGISVSEKNNNNNKTIFNSTRHVRAAQNSNSFLLLHFDYYVVHFNAWYKFM